MVLSMTGFGRSKMQDGPLSVTVEIKTVNHRFSEYHIRMPRQLMKLEDKLKKKLTAHIHRGRVEVFVTLDGEGTFKRKLHVDWELLDDFHRFMENARLKFGLKEEISLQSLLNRDDIIHIEDAEEDNEQIQILLLSAVETAAIDLLQMRRVEGKALEKDIKAHLALLATFVKELRLDAPSVVSQFKERLTKRMQEFLNGSIDESRIIAEVAVFAEKADINEELTRLYSHIQQFLLVLDEPYSIGRKLDFLLQEMNREANTIGSKANDSVIAGKVVEIKSLLEKMKEQVQNIE